VAAFSRALLQRHRAAWYTCVVPDQSDNRSDSNAMRCEALLGSKRALFVGAHPDDIEFRAGGLVYLLRKRGAELVFAIATRGGKGLAWPLRRHLERLRTRHQLRAAEILGSIEVVFYDYPDGALRDLVEPLTQDLISLIDARAPDVVLCWDPQFVSAPHPDHKAAADAASRAARDVKACFYGAPTPNLWVALDKEAVRAKIRAIRAHATEAPPLYFDLRARKWLLAWMAKEGARIGCDYAETFRIA
jgi:LmbE family N-acetylglucosaminyl deacetylase